MKHTTFFLLGVFSLLLAACGGETSTPVANVSLANPASVYCEENGGTVDLRSDNEGNVSGICIFPDGSECDEWAFFRGECAPGEAESPAAATQVENTVATPIALPTAMPIDPAAYEGWWTYTHPVYGFSLLLPEDWVVEEVTTGDPLMNGHLLNLHPREDALVNIRMTFRYPDEDVLLWPTGVGAGEFIEQGTLRVAGEEARRMLFICPSGQVQSIWYHGMDAANLLRGDVEFGFLFSLLQGYCEEGYSLDGKNQHVGEMIIASLRVP